MGVWITFAAVGVSAIAVVGIGVILYAVYKSRNNEKPYATKKNKSKSKDSCFESINYEDIKAKLENKSIRQRNVQKSPPKDGVEAVIATTVNDFSSHKCHQEVQTQNIPETTRMNNQETQTEISTEEPVLLNTFCNNLCHQDSQTSDSLITCNVFPYNVGLNLDFCSNDLSDVNTTSNNDTESVYSVASSGTISSVSSDKHIPTWFEMSDSQKSLCKCVASCGRIVTTVTYPCKHPYCCGECAPIFFKFYHRCPCCKHRIKSYDNVF